MEREREGRREEEREKRVGSSLFMFIIVAIFYSDHMDLITSNDVKLLHLSIHTNGEHTALESDVQQFPKVEMKLAGSTALRSTIIRTEYRWMCNLGKCIQTAKSI